MPFIASQTPSAPRAFPDQATKSGNEAKAREQGKHLGIGFSTYVEICGVAPSAWIGTTGQGWGAGLWESANVRVHLTGKVVVTTGCKPFGQGHETTMAQVVADELGIASAAGGELPIQVVDEVLEHVQMGEGDGSLIDAGLGVEGGHHAKADGLPSGTSPQTGSR